MILINIGARFIVNELNEDQLKIVNSTNVRRIMIIFSSFYGNKIYIYYNNYRYNNNINY